MAPGATVSQLPCSSFVPLFTVLLQIRESLFKRGVYNKHCNTRKTCVCTVTLTLCVASPDHHPAKFCILLPSKAAAARERPGCRHCRQPFSMPLQVLFGCNIRTGLDPAMILPMLAVTQIPVVPVHHAFHQPKEETPEYRCRQCIRLFYIS